MQSTLQHLLHSCPAAEHHVPGGRAQAEGAHGVQGESLLPSLESLCRRVVPCCPANLLSQPLP